MISQNRTFNRTGRQTILLTAIEKVIKPETHSVELTRLSPDEWYEEISTEDAEASRVYFDFSSQLFNHRVSAGRLTEVISTDWSGQSVDLPADLFDGGHRLQLSVRVALDSSGARGGLIVASSSKLTLLTGDGSDPTDGGGSSALRIVPHQDVTEELWKLQLNDPVGPIVYLNTNIVNWKDFKEVPHIKYGILPGVVRSIYFDIGINQHAPKSWAKTWLSFSGAAGRIDEMPEFDDVEDVTKILDWASNVAEDVAADTMTYKRFCRDLEEVSADE